MCVFGPEYRGDVEIVGLKVWYLLEIVERQLHENAEMKLTETPRKKTKKRIFWQISILLYD